jgi:hypothetical protein
VVSCATLLNFFSKKLGEIWQLVFEKKEIFFVEFLNQNSVSPFEKNKKEKKQKKKKKVLNTTQT